MADFHVNRSVLSGLSHLNSRSKHFSDDALDQFSSSVFSIVLEKQPVSVLDEISVSDPLVLKQSYSAFVSLIMDASRIDCDPLSFRGVLTEFNVDDGRAEKLSSAYERNRRDLRSLLSSTTYSFPHVVDVDWRLDYCLKSHALEKIDQPSYHVSLSTEKPDGEAGEVTFTCSLQEMQDLVYKLRDAANHTRMLAETT